VRESTTRAEHLSDPGKEARAKAGIPIVPAFDGFRAYAILGVVIIHLIQISGVAAAAGDSTGRALWGSFGRAVEVLFVVSGFVVFLPTAARGGEFGPLAPYAIRRGARLLPAYWLIILISILLIVVFGPTDPVLRDLPIPVPDLGNALLNLTALAVPAGLFSGDVSVGLGIDPPLWTLSAELGFYILLPFVATAFFRRPWIGLAVSAAITFAWMYSFDNIGWLIRELDLGTSGGESLRLKFASFQQLPEWAFSFGLGMFSAAMWVRLQDPGARPRRERIARVGIPLALGATVLSAWVLGADRELTRESVVWSMLFSASIAALMLSITLAPARWQSLFTVDPIRKLGDFSYGIYLSHFVILTMVVWAFDLPSGGSFRDLLVLTALVVPASVLYGYLSARFLEQPIRRWARRYGRTVPEEAATNR